MLLFWPFVSAGLLLASLGSHGWAMRKFFTKPTGDESGMKLIRLCGTISAVLHAVAVLVTRNVAPLQGASGAVLYVTGLLLFFSALRAHGRRPLSAAFSADRPSHLVDWGPYRYIRHPFYTAYLLTWIAGVAATGRLWLIPSVGVMAWIYVRAANMEEKKFAFSPLSVEYQRYVRDTGMFLPKLHCLLKLLRKERDAAAVAQHRT